MPYALHLKKWGQTTFILAGVAEFFEPDVEVNA
jgi:hypothetical protein